MKEYIKNDINTYMLWFFSGIFCFIVGLFLDGIANISSNTVLMCVGTVLIITGILVGIIGSLGFWSNAIREFDDYSKHIAKIRNTVMKKFFPKKYFAFHQKNVIKNLNNITNIRQLKNIDEL